MTTTDLLALMATWIDGGPEACRAMRETADALEGDGYIGAAERMRKWADNRERALAAHTGPQARGTSGGEA